MSLLGILDVLLLLGSTTGTSSRGSNLLQLILVTTAKAVVGRQPLVGLAVLAKTVVLRGPGQAETQVSIRTRNRKNALYL